MGVRKSIITRVLLTACILWLQLMINVLADDDDTDRIALLAIKSGLKYIPREKMNSWNESIHVCEWEGITCSRESKRVISLNLTSFGVVGTFSPYIGNITFLEKIDISNNVLQGQLPPEIGRLSGLQHLNLTNNSMEGKIPNNLFQCSKLVHLSLESNKFVGKIPQELGRLHKLEYLSFRGNHFTGEIPKSIGNLTCLKTLVLRSNQLVGTIPDIFSSMNQLSEINLRGNILIGTIPPSLYNLSQLGYLSLSDNKLHGKLPLNFGLLWPELFYFHISHNNFSGSIPSSFSNATKLVNVQMNSNSLSGKLSVDFSRMQRLRKIRIRLNYLGTGADDDLGFITTLLNCSNIRRIVFSYNYFGGSLPKTLSSSNLSSPLEALSLRGNRIDGYIPKWIGILTHLTVLSLQENQLVGPIPENLGNLKELNGLFLSNNMLSGNIPASLGNLTSMVKLDLSSNNFNGSIPSTLGSLKRASSLDLSGNGLDGSIPKELFDMTSLSILLNLARNRLDGSLHEDVGNLQNLGILDVSNNELSGVIPTNLGKCISLEVLRMANNSFAGAIPSPLSTLLGLGEIDFSRNNLSGKIPSYLTRFQLTYLNFSFNDFEGDVPLTGVFKNVTRVSLDGNARLCGGISELNLPDCLAAEKQTMSRLAIIIITVAASFVLGVALFFAWIYFGVKRKMIEHIGSSIETFPKISYALLYKCTEGFSGTNLIGVGGFGSVYKGVIQPGEQVVAIKVLNLQRHGANKSFIAEYEALRSIRHRNLLNIINLCIGVDFEGNDFKALITEFMPNGGLDTWLHGNMHQRTLNLVQMITIFIDIASALEYLHCDCKPPIIHCDLKPGNILLDSGMVAHVGDFGLAKFLQDVANSNESTPTGIGGTVGYVAPEYGVGSMVSTSGDIYSFGIMLLEMTTGQKPTSDALFEEGYNLHTFARTAFPDRVLHIVDPILLLNNDEEQLETTNKVEECVISLVKIGIACSMDLPQDRMDITSILHQLHHIKRKLKLRVCNWRYSLDTT